ncbi:TPA: hypothetical protein EYP44_04525, partial [Candidatus Bathyarchaeota archaeon]|nr:hypothetical protein [Candidatus Bathyarchaeota archaeon]
MSVAFVESLLSATVRVGTPLLLAALGELYAERSGVLNLGVEGMMIMGAFMGFYITYVTKNLVLAALFAALAGALIALIHAFLTVTLRANQIVSGLAIVIFGLGLSGFLGRPYTGLRVPTFKPVPIPFLKNIGNSKRSASHPRSEGSGRTGS